MKIDILKIVDRVKNSNDYSISSLMQMINNENIILEKNDLLDLISKFIKFFYYTPDYIGQLISEISKIYHPKNVIDICCGTGNILNNLENINQKTGIDINPEIIQIAKYLNKDVNFVVGNTINYIFQETFDLVVGSIPYFGFSRFDKNIEKEIILKGLSILSDNGIAIFVMPNSILNGNYHAETRKIIKDNYVIDFIISLQPDQNQFSLIQLTILVIRKGKAKDKIFLPIFQYDIKSFINEYKEQKGDFYLPYSKLEYRFDREYYNPKYNIDNLLGNEPLKELNKLAIILKHKPINRENITNKGKYKIFTDNKIEKYTNELIDEKFILRQNDIIVRLTNFKFIGKYIDENYATITDNNYAIIRSNDENNYISIFLNTKQGQELFSLQVSKFAHGTSFNTTNISVLNQILVPIFPIEKITKTLLEEQLRKNRIDELEKLIQELKEEKYQISELESIPIYQTFKHIEQKENLKNMWIKVSENNITGQEKGKRFEVFVSELFGSFFKIVSCNLLTENGELDIILENYNTEPFWLEYGSDIFVECKNWNSHSPLKEVATFIEKVSSSNVKLGFFISMSGFTTDAIVKFKNNTINKQKPLIVPISGDDINELIDEKYNINQFLKDKIRNIKYLNK